ncbi:MAG: ABC transporter ATP-binding protein [Alloprevotella sp.]
MATLISETLALEAASVSKRFGKVEALRGIDLKVRQGEIFGLIGPDGAGKTTLFRLIASLLLPTAGKLRLCGINVESGYRKVRRIIGYMPGRFSLYADLTVEENLKFFASTFGTTLEANRHLVEDIYCQIARFKDRRAGALSGGMKQKLALCCALIHKPQVLLLDEPTTGVDPVSRKEFWDMLHKLRSEGGLTIIVSTPYMDEANCCDRIALMNEGRVLLTDTPQGIVSACPDTFVAVSGSNMHGLLRDVRTLPGVKSAFAFGRTHHVSISTDTDAAAVQQALRRLGYADAVAETVEPDIEDCFMVLSAN